MGRRARRYLQGGQAAREFLIVLLPLASIKRELTRIVFAELEGASTSTAKHGGRRRFDGFGEAERLEGTCEAASSECIS
jgi:hypothetical protein